jgi:hypothetical protein
MGKIERESREFTFWVASAHKGERESLFLFLKNRQQEDFFNLNNSILHLSRIADFPVQQDAVIDTIDLQEREPCEF